MASLNNDHQTNQLLWFKILELSNRDGIDTSELINSLNMTALNDQEILAISKEALYLEPSYRNTMLNSILQMSIYLIGLTD